MTRELIESQINSQIPRAKVTSQCIDEKHLSNARAVERMCDYYVKKLNFAILNDVDERQTYTFGGSIWLPEFDSGDVEGNKVGAIDIRVCHPKFFTPQPGVSKVREMDYCFIDIPLPREEIERRYGVELEDNEGELPMDDGDYDIGEESAGEIVLLHVCFYRNDERNVCQYIWTDNLEILDIDDYYARKVRYCENCGRRAELCEDSPCESPSFIEVEETEETVYEDIYDSKGNLLIPAQTQEYKNGEPQFDTVSQPVVDESGRPIVREMGGYAVPVTQEALVPRMIQTVIP